MEVALLLICRKVKEATNEEAVIMELRARLIVFGLRV